MFASTRNMSQRLKIMRATSCKKLPMATFPATNLWAHTRCREVCTEGRCTWSLYGGMAYVECSIAGKVRFGTLEHQLALTLLVSVARHGVQTRSSALPLRASSHLLCTYPFPLRSPRRGDREDRWHGEGRRCLPWMHASAQTTLMRRSSWRRL